MSLHSHKVVELNLPNVHIEQYTQKRVQALLGTVAKYGIDNHLFPLIEALAVKHPEWEFRCKDSRAYGGQDDLYDICAQEFSVFHKREEIGSLSTDYSYGHNKYMFSLTNDRIYKEMTKTKDIKTANLSKAVKIAEKYFSVRTPTEIVEVAMVEADHAMHMQSSIKAGSMNSLQGKVFDNFMRFVISHMDMLMQSLHDQKDKDRIHEYIKLSDEVKLLESIRDELDGFKAIFVFQNEQTYLVKERGSLMSLQAEQLSEHVRHKLGVLKLVENNQAVENVGFRVSEHSFVLFGRGDSHE